jgi:catechol 2,3-dioxygenase-like lactoylglutathione lyase family enzyme
MAPLVPEFYVSDFVHSLSFYTDVLGFTVRYARPEEKFAYLEHNGAELMIEQPIGRVWLQAELQHPYGRGLNLQITTQNAQALYRLVNAASTVVQPIERRTYRRALDTVEVEQFVIADPDGYLLRFSELLATMPARSPATP